MYTFRLTEEISRWAFEVSCANRSCWFIAFTNPTAGPWKTIKCTNSDGKVGEVYRFELEETRPDILLVNDNLRLIIVIEAKDSLTKLISGNQVEKSVEVVNQLSSILGDKRHNPFWGERADYCIITGILWGAETSSTNKERDAVFDRYFSELSKYNLDKRIIIGVETCRNGDGLICSIYGKSYEKSGASSIETDAIVDSFSHH